MANPVKGEVPIQISGQSYTLVLGTYALALMERRAGMSWSKMFKKAEEGNWGVSDVLMVFHAALLRHHKSITEEQAADLMDQAGIEYIGEKIREAVTLMQPAGTGGGQGAENPPPATNGSAAGTSSSLSGSP